MEKRKHPRWNLSGLVRVKQSGVVQDEVQAQGNDISLGGMSFLVQARHAPEAELELIIELPDDYRFIFAKARVAWQEDMVSQEQKSYTRTGVYFSALADADKARIFNYAYKFCRDELMKKWWDGLDADSRGSHR